MLHQGLIVKARFSKEDIFNPFYTRCWRKKTKGWCLMAVSYCQNFLGMVSSKIQLLVHKPPSLESAPPRQHLDDQGFLKRVRAYDTIVCYCFLLEKMVYNNFSRKQFPSIVGRIETIQKWYDTHCQSQNWCVSKGCRLRFHNLQILNL